MAATTRPETKAMTNQPSPKQQFLDSYDREHAITKKILDAYPPEKAELRPHPKLKTARELAFIFALERGLATAVMHDKFAAGGPGEFPKAPDNWSTVLAAVEKGHADFRDLVRNMPDAELFETVKFFTGPKTLSDVRRIDFLWFILSDEIHHRGQMSVYLRMADAKVPSIYGPSGDEPWF